MGLIFTAIGNSCTDLIASVDDDFLVKHHFPKSYCAHLTSTAQLNALKSALPPYTSIPGGAGANVAHVVSALGGNAHFISKIASDDEGLNFKKHLEENGVPCHFPPPSSPTIGSTIVVTLVTPDKERTFVSYDMVARTMNFDDYDLNLLSQTDYLYLDGYSFCSPGCAESFIKAAEIIRQRNGHVTFNVGDISIYEANTESIDKLLTVCDSIMCNKDEAEMFFGHFANLHELAVHMASRFMFGAVTDGANGATVFLNGVIKHIPAAPLTPSEIVDTNGAGDHFAGGFIFGLMNEYDLEQAGHCGILCATDCVTHMGARPLGGHSSLKHLAEGCLSDKKMV